MRKSLDVCFICFKTTQDQTINTSKKSPAYPTWSHEPDLGEITKIISETLKTSIVYASHSNRSAKFYQSRSDVSLTRKLVHCQARTEIVVQTIQQDTAAAYCSRRRRWSTTLSISLNSRIASLSNQNCYLLNC